MAAVSLVGSKVILALCNFLLLSCGFTLVTGGMLVLFDSERILLSKLLATGPFTELPQPFFYYMAVGLALVGLVLAAAGILGCWASCLSSYCLLTFYFLVVMLVLVSECAIYIVAWMWPQCMGLGIDSQTLTRALQRNYGVSGQEQFTAALDLVQSTFNCCGIDSANEYDTSLWRLQALGPSLAIPLTCCVLENQNQSRAYLNPVPKDSTLCQALEKQRHERYRHTNSCLPHIDQWYREHYVMFLAVGLAVVLIEFLVLISTILTCTRVYHHNMREIHDNDKNSTIQEPTHHSFESTESIFTKPHAPVAGNSGVHSGYTNDTYALSDRNFSQNYKMLDRV